MWRFLASISEPTRILFEKSVKLPCTAQPRCTGTDNGHCLATLRCLCMCDLFCLKPIFDAAEVDVTPTNQPVIANTSRIKPSSIGTAHRCFPRNSFPRLSDPQTQNTVSDVQVCSYLAVRYVVSQKVILFWVESIRIQSRLLRSYNALTGILLRRYVCWY